MAKFWRQLVQINNPELVFNFSRWRIQVNLYTDLEVTAILSMRCIGVEMINFWFQLHLISLHKYGTLKNMEELALNLLMKNRVRLKI
jgi:hypothetical protein